MIKILLYYKYVPIQYPKQIQKWLEKLCLTLDLKGRIIIAHEGINGTIGGDKKNIEIYKSAMLKHELFSDIDFKESESNEQSFAKLRIVVRNEIVTLGIDPKQINAKDAAQHLNVDDVHELISSNEKDLVIFDSRNNYESNVGYFKGATLADIKYFRELPSYIDSNQEIFKDKKILMYCTGGIRCERASAYLKSKNIAKEIFQIEGGIHKYVEKYPDGFFKGKNYVFDARVTVTANNEIVGKCYICHSPYDNYINCLNASCNRHFICCPNCIKDLQNRCSKECIDLINNNKVKVRPVFKKVESITCH